MDFFETHVRQVIECRVEQEARKVIEDAKRALEQNLASIVASTTIEVLKYVTFERFGQELRITVKMDTK